MVQSMPPKGVATCKRGQHWPAPQELPVPAQLAAFVRGCIATACVLGDGLRGLIMSSLRPTPALLHTFISLHSLCTPTQHFQTDVPGARTCWWFCWAGIEAAGPVVAGHRRRPAVVGRGVPLEVQLACAGWLTHKR